MWTCKPSKLKNAKFNFSSCPIVFDDEFLNSFRIKFGIRWYRMTGYNSDKNPSEQSRREENLCDRKVTVILPVTATRYSTTGSTSSFI